MLLANYPSYKLKKSYSAKPGALDSAGLDEVKHCLGLIILKTLKIYITNNLVNNFIQLFKSFAQVFIIVDLKLDKNF